MKYHLLSACLAALAAADVQFDRSLIPSAGDCDFPVFSLGSPAIVPEVILAQIVNDTAPAAQVHRSDGGAIAAFDGARLVALVNQTTGETKIFPSLDALLPAQAAIDTGIVAQHYLSNAQMFPRDDTNFTVVPGASLFGSTHDNGTAPTASLTYLTHAWVRRSIVVGGTSYPACGPGGKASFGVGADGSVRSLSHRWKPATTSSTTVRPASPDAVYAAIQAQLSSSGDQVRLRSVDICFYDSGVGFVQPVYRFTANIGPDIAGQTDAATAGVSGFVPLGDSAVEPLPDLTVPSTRSLPVEPASNGSPTTSCSTPMSGPTEGPGHGGHGGHGGHNGGNNGNNGWGNGNNGWDNGHGSQHTEPAHGHGSWQSEGPHGSQPSAGAWPSQDPGAWPSQGPSGATPTHSPWLKERQLFGPQIKVGRYIDRTDPTVYPKGFTQWYENSWEFLDGLQGAQFNPFNFQRAEFIDDQYLWAYPYMFTSDKDSYVNTVHIADTEVHGNWHIFWTFYNTADTVNLETDIPADGYGPGAGGNLAYWILHSCEVIPTVMDYSAANVRDAWDTWFNIFNGMHAAVGYRTEMWIGDGVTGPFGSAIGSGAAVVSSWMNIAHDDTAAYLPVQYDNENGNGIEEPFGRPAAVAVCGHADDVVTDVENLGRPGCLTMWWYDNST